MKPADKPSEALKILAEKIANREVHSLCRYGDFLCIDIAQLRDTHLITEQAAADARAHIRFLLGRRAGIGDWLLEYHPEYYNEAREARNGDAQSRDKWLAYNLAWVHDMISYFESQGQ